MGTPLAFSVSSHSEEVYTTRYLATTALVALTLATAACGGGGGGGGSTSSSPTAPSPTTSTPANAVTITILREAGAQSFSPNPAMAGGQQVVFKNTDSIVHRVVLNDGSIDTGNLAPGATSAVFTMPAAGTNYHCSIHPTMIGAVSGSAGDAPPPCTGYCDGSPTPTY